MNKLIEFITEVVGWLQIVASPLLIGLSIGTIVYVSNPSTARLVFGISIAALGLIIGIIWATNIWKKTGTMRFMSRIMATPELDPLETTENDQNDNPPAEHSQKAKPKE